MTATVVSSNPSTSRKSRAATLALILFPIVIGVSMLWLRHVEVQRLASRQIQGYGSVPPFQSIRTARHSAVLISPAKSGSQISFTPLAPAHAR
jgi:hypothetical protein